MPLFVPPPSSFDPEQTMMLPIVDAQGNPRYRNWASSLVTAEIALDKAALRAASKPGSIPDQQDARPRETRAQRGAAALAEGRREVLDAPTVAVRLPTPTYDEPTVAVQLGTVAGTAAVPPAGVDAAQGMRTAQTGGVVRAGLLLAVAAVASRLTGFLAKVAFITVFGAAMVNSSYTLANTLPNIVFELLIGGVLTSVAIPLLARAQRTDPDGGEEYTQRLVTLGVVGLLVATTLAVLAAPLIAKIYLSDESQVDPNLTTQLSYLLLPQIFFYGVASLFGAILNTKERFAAQAWAPVLNNLVLIAMAVSFVFFWTADPDSLTKAQILFIGLGTTAGIVLQSVVMLPSLRRSGFRFKWRFGWDKRMAEAGSLAGWAVLYVLVSQVGYAVTTNIASSATAGGIAIFAFASLLFQMPYGILGVSILTAIMPRMSRHAAAGQMDEVKNDMSLANRLSAVALLPVAAGIIALAGAVGVLTASYGQSSIDVGITIGVTLGAMAIGLLPLAMSLVQMRVFYAMKDGRTPVLINAIMVVVRVLLLLLAAWFAERHDLGFDVLLPGIALATAMSYVVGAVVGEVWLRARFGPMGTRRVLRTIARMAVASAFGGLAAWGVVQYGWGGFPDTLLDAALQCISAGIFGLVVILGVALLLRVEELTPVIARFRPPSKSGGSGKSGGPKGNGPGASGPGGGRPGPSGPGGGGPGGGGPGQGGPGGGGTGGPNGPARPQQAPGQQVSRQPGARRPGTGQQGLNQQSPNQQGSARPGQRAQPPAPQRSDQLRPGEQRPRQQRPGGPGAHQGPSHGVGQASAAALGAAALAAATAASAAAAAAGLSNEPGAGAGAVGTALLTKKIADADSRDDVPEPTQVTEQEHPHDEPADAGPPGPDSPSKPGTVDSTMTIRRQVPVSGENGGDSPTAQLPPVPGSSPNANAVSDSSSMTHPSGVNSAAGAGQAGYPQSAQAQAGSARTAQASANQTPGRTPSPQSATDDPTTAFTGGAHSAAPARPGGTADHTNQLSPGAVVGGRYRLVNLVAVDSMGNRFWRAKDTVLPRDMAVTLLPDSPSVAATVARSLRAGRLNHIGLPQTLDLGTERGESYIVGQWVEGATLTDLLVSGPLEGEIASSITSKVAEAVAEAHRNGICLGAIHPSLVRVNFEGQVRISHVVAQASATSDQDIKAIGALLYLMLTGTWPLPQHAAAPGGTSPTLPPAPASGGHARPAQEVRPQAPPALAALADRALHPESPQGVRSAAAIAALLRDPSATSSARSTPQSATAVPEVDEPTESVELPSVGVAEKKIIRERRIKLSIAAGMILVLAALISIVLGSFSKQLVTSLEEPDPENGLITSVASTLVPTSGGSAVTTARSTPGSSSSTQATTSGSNPTTTAPTTTSAPVGLPVRIVSGTVYDPQGDGEKDYVNYVDQAFDGNQATAWMTYWYKRQFPSLKEGVGLTLELEKEIVPTSITVASTTAGTRVVIRTSTSADPATLADTVPIATADLGQQPVEIALQNAPKSKYITVFITQLGAAVSSADGQSGGFESNLTEISVKGS